MRRFLKPPTATIIALALTACLGDTPSTTVSETGSGGWRIAPSGHLNEFFDCLATGPRTLVSAHRGGPAPGFPENAIETFAQTLSVAPALIEMDVATTADGVLFLMHDDTLDRTTTGSGVAADTNWRDIKTLRLVDANGQTTDFHPPRFADAIAFLKDRTITQIDFKRSTRFEDAIAEIRDQDAEGRVVLIAYSMAQAAKLHRLAPDMMISLSLDSQSDINSAVAAGVPTDRLLAFTGLDEARPRLNSILADRTVEVIFGTLGGRDSIDREIERSRTPERYADIARTGVDILATDRPIEAHRALAREDLDAKGCGIMQG